jgi:hypothetical protein
MHKNGCIPLNLPNENLTFALPAQPALHRIHKPKEDAKT